MSANGSLALAPLALLALAARKRIAALLLLVFVALHLAYVQRAGGDWMPYGRFVLPLLPVALVLAAWGGQWIADAVRPVLGRASLVLLLYRWRRWRSWCTGPSGTSPPNRCSR